MKQALEELFEAMYHGNPSVHGFLNSSMKQNYKVVDLGSGGRRKILSPTEELKTYHRFLNLFLIESLPINERVVFSYRKGCGAVNAVEKHSGGRYFFQTDISSFFGSIDQDLVKRVILAGAHHSPIADVENHLDRIMELICIDGSLPVGLPVSAPMSNCALFSFDNSIEEFCAARGLTYTRYADDIIISARDNDDLQGMDRVVQEKLHACASQKLNINRAKTKFFQIGGKIKILGIMILPNGRLSPDTKKKRDLEVLLHYYITDRSKFNSRIVEMKTRPDKEAPILDESEFADILSGNLTYVDSIDPDYTNKLRKKFGTATIDKLIHKSFSSKK